MISEYLGIDSDYIVIGLAALVLILIIVMIVNAAKMHSLKKAYNNFMTGKDAKNLEDTILKRLDKVEQLMDSNEKNEKNINRKGCYTYIKEIIDGNSVITLSEEEQEALDMALNSNKK